MRRTAGEQLARGAEVVPRGHRPLIRPVKLKNARSATNSLGARTPKTPGQGKRHRETTSARHAGTADARPPAVRRGWCRAPRRRRRSAAVPAAAKVAVTAAATAPPPRAAPPPRTFPQVRCACPTPPHPVARPWPPCNTRGEHAARRVGGGVGGGTPRRTVSGQWPATGGRGGGGARHRRQVARAVVRAPVPDDAPPPRADAPLPPRVRAGGRPLPHDPPSQ